MKTTQYLIGLALFAAAIWGMVILDTAIAHAQSPVLPYSVQSSAQKPVGDGSSGSKPMPVTIFGTPPSPGIYVFTPLGCYQMTSLGSATNLPTVPTGATLVNLTIESEGVRYRDDGTSPTATIGELLAPGGPWPYSGSLTAIQFIQIGASAIIDYCAYK